MSITTGQPQIPLIQFYHREGSETKISTSQTSEQNARKTSKLIEINLNTMRFRQVEQDSAKKAKKEASMEASTALSMAYTGEAEIEQSIEVFNTEKNHVLYQTILQLRESELKKLQLKERERQLKKVNKELLTINKDIKSNTKLIKRELEEKKTIIEAQNKELTEAKTVIERKKTHKIFLILLSVIILGIATGFSLYTERLETKLEQVEQLNNEQFDTITTLNKKLEPVEQLNNEQFDTITTLNQKLEQVEQLNNEQFDTITTLNQKIANMIMTNKNLIQKLSNWAKKLFEKQH